LICFFFVLEPGLDFEVATDGTSPENQPFPPVPVPMVAVFSLAYLADSMSGFQSLDQIQLTRPYWVGKRDDILVKNGCLIDLIML